MDEGKALEDPETTYFDELKNRLDLILTLTEQGTSVADDSLASVYLGDNTRCLRADLPI